MNQKFSFAAIAVMVAVSLSSCSFEYKANHPHHQHHQRHNKVIVVGMTKPAIPADSVCAELAQHNRMNKTCGINNSKS